MGKPSGMFGNHHSSMVHDMARMPILQCDWIGAAESSVPIGLERLRARLCSAAKFFEFPLNLVRSFFLSRPSFAGEQWSASGEDDGV